VAALAERVAVALTAQHLDHLGADVDVVDVTQVLVVVGQDLLHVGVRGRGTERVLEEGVPRLGDGVDDHGRGRAALRVVAVGGLLAADAEHDVGGARGDLHPGRPHGVEAGRAAVRHAHAGLVAHPDEASQDRLGDGHVLKDVVVDAVDDGPDHLGRHPDVFQRRSYGHLEQLPVGRLDPPGAAFRDARTHDCDSFHPMSFLRRNGTALVTPTWRHL